MMLNKNNNYFIQNYLEKRKADHRLRTLRPMLPCSAVEVMIDDRKLVNFSSNDYLGLSKHPLLQQRSIDWVQRFGNSATASRLICGNLKALEQLEETLARLKNAEAALIMNSGYQANITLIPAMADSKTLILSDELNHNSIIQGCLLARCEKAIFRHNDMAHLQQLLQNSQNKGYSRILIITETIFSMDGDRCDLQAVQRLAQQYNALLIVDEAHATGVMGLNGMGLNGMGLATGKSADIVIGTFGKALGSYGAYVVCSQDTKEYLINCCNGLIFSTALPPAVLGAIEAALEIIPTMHTQRKLLKENATYLRKALTDLGYNTGLSSTQIIPYIIGSDTKTIKLATWLENNNVLATAIRPPTVPEDTARIRLAMSSEHTREQIDRLIELFIEYFDEN
ncbi:MAG: 8-amino-7-oxononanoate synthase [Gammaproteobacteria bacterium]|nr:8-amino-7-oxononanoate synthase [Gammaproteobacteria bacterium]